MTEVATRPGTWREARKDLPVLGKDGHVWTLAKLEKDPATGRPLVTMTRTIPTSGEMLQPIPIEKAVLVNWDDPINVVIEEPRNEAEAAAPTPYEPPPRPTGIEPVHEVPVNGAGPTPLEQGVPVQDLATAMTSLIAGNTPSGWAVPPTADWTAAEMHSHEWLMHGWTEELGPLPAAHARHGQMHANPSGGLPHFHRV
jgi:hypothetical protein